jgi:hypothetical protein
LGLEVQVVVEGVLMGGSFEGVLVV